MLRPAAGDARATASAASCEAVGADVDEALTGAAWSRARAAAGAYAELAVAEADVVVPIPDD